MLDLNKLRSQEGEQHHLITSRDGTQLFLRNWNESPKLKTAFLMLHGITAHSKAYGIISKPLAELGFPSYGLDLRGHGLSDGPRGDYTSFETLLEDFSATIDFLSEKHDKVVLVGHSLGVITASIFGNHFPDNIGGMVLLSAARSFREGAYPKRPLMTTLKILFWSIIKPSKTIIHYYRDGITGLDDPLFNFYYTLRFLKIISAKTFTLPEKMDYPAFVAVGDNDELFSEAAVRELFNELTAANKKFELLANCKHAEFGDDSFDPLFSWVSEQFK